jgi:predicted RND superfamily exporter protein
MALVILAAVTAIFAAGLPRLTTSVGYRAFLGDSHPAVARLDAFIERFGAGLPVAAVWSCAETEQCSSVFDRDSLRMAAAVAAALEATPGVRRVESPATSELLVPTDDGFDPRTLLENGELQSDHAALCERAVIDPVWVGALVSPDARVGAVVAELQSSDSDTSVEVFEALREALAPFEEDGFRFHLVGGPVEFVIAGGELQAAMARIVPVMVALIALVLWVLYRSAGNVAAALAAMGVALLWTIGLIGWLGWPQNSITQTLPPLVLVIGVCDSIHLLARYASELAILGRTDRSAREEAVQRAALDVAAPCVITTVTTAAGLLSFVTSGLESFVRFGAISAFGVSAALLLSFTLLPIACVWLPGTPARIREESARWENSLASLVRFSRRRARSLLVVAGVVGAAGVYGMSTLRVDAAFEDLYGEDSQVVQWVKFVETNLRQPDTLEIEVVLPAGERFEDPSAVEELKRLALDLSEIPGLGEPHSILDPVAWVNRLLNDDDPAYERTEATAAANAQLLLMLELNSSHKVGSWLSIDNRHVRISMESGKEPQERLRQILVAVHQRLEALPREWKVHVSGPLAMVHDMIEEIKVTQLRSFATAAVVVMALVSIFMRSFFWALLAMVPTALPVVVTLGAMGFL